MAIGVDLNAIIFTQNCLDLEMHENSDPGGICEAARVSAEGTRQCNIRETTDSPIVLYYGNSQS
jgi:hypothetical protein